MLHLRTATRLFLVLPFSIFLPSTYLAPYDLPDPELQKKPLSNKSTNKQQSDIPREEALGSGTGKDQNHQNNKAQKASTEAAPINGNQKSTDIDEIFGRPQFDEKEKDLAVEKKTDSSEREDKNEGELLGKGEVEESQDVEGKASDRPIPPGPAEPQIGVVPSEDSWNFGTNAVPGEENIEKHVGWKDIEESGLKRHLAKTEEKISKKEEVEKVSPSRKELESFMSKLAFSQGDDKLRVKISFSELVNGKFPKTKNFFIGFTGFLSEGAYALYGRLILHGILAYLSRINFLGGIRGKMIRLVTMDDGGEPEKAVENIRKMRYNGVGIFLGVMGTRSLKKLARDAQELRSAILFPWGGSPELRQRKYRGFVFGLGAMEPQIKEIVSKLVDEMAIEKIAIFHDDSSFGNNNLEVAIRELGKRGITPVTTAAYNRFTVDVRHPAKKIMSGNPKAIICLSTSVPTVKLINLMFENGYFGTVFLGIDSTLFVQHMLRQRGARFSFTSIIPDPVAAAKSGIPIAKRYIIDSLALFPDDPINVLSFAYYVNAATVVRAIFRGNSDAPVSVVTYIEAMTGEDLGGFVIDFDPESRLAYNPVVRLIGEV